jgi:hypothetical protein
MDDPLRKENRFQNQNWLVKLWRRRWLILVPFEALMIWIRNKDDLWFKDCWGIAHGLAHMPGRMNWIYDWDEVKGMLEDKIVQQEQELGGDEERAVVMTSKAFADNLDMAADDDDENGSKLN